MEPSLRTTSLRVKLSNSTPQELLVLAVSLNNPQKIRRFRHGSARCVHPCTGAEHHRALCRVRSYLAQLAIGGLCFAVTTAPWSYRFFLKNLVITSIWQFNDGNMFFLIEWNSQFSEPYWLE